MNSGQSNNIVFFRIRLLFQEYKLHGSSSISCQTTIRVNPVMVAAAPALPLPPRGLSRRPSIIGYPKTCFGPAVPRRGHEPGSPHTLSDFICFSLCGCELPFMLGSPEQNGLITLFFYRFPTSAFMERERGIPAPDTCPRNFPCTPEPFISPDRGFFLFRANYCLYYDSCAPPR